MTGVEQIDLAVGANVRRLREAVGTSLEQLAGVGGLTKAELVLAEAGDRRLRASELFQLAQALDVPPSRFFKDLASTRSLSSQ